MYTLLFLAAVAFLLFNYRAQLPAVLAWLKAELAFLKGLKFGKVSATTPAPAPAAPQTPPTAPAAAPAAPPAAEPAPSPAEPLAAPTPPPQAGGGHAA